MELVRRREKEASVTQKEYGKAFAVLTDASVELTIAKYDIKTVDSKAICYTLLRRHPELSDLDLDYFFRLGSAVSSPLWTTIRFPSIATVLSNQ